MWHETLQCFHVGIQTHSGSVCAKHDIASRWATECVCVCVCVKQRFHSAWASCGRFVRLEMTERSTVPALATNTVLLCSNALICSQQSGRCVHKTLAPKRLISIQSTPYLAYTSKWEPFRTWLHSCKEWILNWK